LLFYHALLYPPALFPRGCTSIRRSASLDGYRLSSADGNGHIDVLSTTLTNFGRYARYASAQASELKDAASAAIFTEIARGIDKRL
jgi:starvation-inducible DNA-binding protein